MVIVKLKGGIGNQLFQYAFASGLANKTACKIILDSSFFQAQSKRTLDLYKYQTFQFKNPNSLGLRLQVWLSKVLLRMPNIFGKTKLIIEDEVVLPADIFKLSYSGITIFDGYWQDERYFKFIRDQLLTEIRPLSLSDLSKNLLKALSLPQTVAIHIRRGDYVTDSNANMTHGTCSLAYYHAAIELAKSKFKSPIFYIFSDDIPWCRRHFSNILNINFVSSDVPDHEALYLMSKCGANIIANSSFSWWAGWLNNRPGSWVICPDKWFADKSRKNEHPGAPSWIKI